MEEFPFATVEAPPPFQCVWVNLVSALLSFGRSAVHPASPPLLCTREDKDVADCPLRIVAQSQHSFEKHIRSILHRSSANPLLLK